MRGEGTFPLQCVYDGCMRSVAVTATTAGVAAGLIVYGAAVAPRARAPLPAAVEAAESSISVADLRGHLHFLASDQLAGRGVGHEGNALAALYLATAFERIGLEKPDGDYYQTFNLTELLLGPENKLSVTVDANAGESGAAYSFGADFYPAPLSASRKVTAAIAFAGYGITAPELGYDDYADLDVSGRIVVAMQHEPEEQLATSRFNGNEPTEHANLERKIENAQARGAVGLILVPDSLVHTALLDARQQWPERTSVRDARFALTSALDSVSIPVAMASASAARELLGDRNDLSLADAQRAIDAALGQIAAVKAVGSFLVPSRRATLEVALIGRPVQSRNVVGAISGSDPSLRAETIVVGAHLDHDGVDAQQRIYNGADDDGSGTVAVVEIAEAFARAARAGQKPRRTLVFALWNAEEKGLLGSRHFVRTPVPVRTKPVLNLNLDMIGRNEEVPDPADQRFRGLGRIDPATTGNVLHILGYSYAPEVAKIAQSESAPLGLALKTDYDHHALELIRRSDHWSFLQRRIPAIFFTTGLHPDYHTPQDDVAKINFRKLERVARLVYRVTWRAAELDAVPRFVEPRDPTKSENRRTNGVAVLRFSLECRQT